MRRSAISIPSNLAEGHRRGTKEFLHFIKIANGSLGELETQLEISFLLNYISNDVKTKSLNSISEIGKMLTGLRKKLSTTN